MAERALYNRGFPFAPPMYNAFFRLNEAPFSIAPDPRFVFMSARHREALAHLMYGLAGEGGFVVLTGEVGTGKTTICRCMLEQVPKDCDVAFMLNPGLSATEMLGAICDELHIAYPDGLNIKGYVDRFNAHLLKANAAGRRTVVIIDEAQLLDPKVLKLLRLLTNLETSRRKLLQIVLLGQPELLSLLARPDLRQVAQRVVARYHLEHLNKLEVSAYVAHRLSVAGSQARLIPESLMGVLYGYTGGVPRLINLVCDRALLGTYVEGRPVVTAPILRKAAAEVLGTRRSLGLPRAAIAAGLVAVAAVAGWLIWDRSAHVGDAVAVAPPPARLASHDGPAAPAVPDAAPAAAKPPIEAPAEAPGAAAKPAQLVLRADVSAEEAETAAFRALFARFGIVYSLHGAARGCAYAESIGLRCYAGQGNTEVFQTYNPPMLLQLQRNGERQAIVLDSLEGRQATFVFAGQSQSAPIESLEGLWTGEYVVLWRPPPGVPGQLQLGSGGAGVQWLSDALAIAAGARPSLRVGSFDAALQERLKAFQAGEGLDADGIAGPLTMLRLAHRVERRLAGAHGRTQADGGGS